MKRSIAFGVVIAAATILLPAPVFAQAQPAALQPDPRSQAVARSIVSIAFPPERRDAMMDKIMSTVALQMRASLSLDKISDPGLKQILTDYLDGIPRMLKPATAGFIPKQMDAVAAAYTRMFPLAELEDIAAFASTPSGRDYLERSTDVLSDPEVAAVNSAYFQQATVISRQGEAQLKEKIAAYFLAHPDAVPKDAAPQPAPAGK